MKLSWDNLTLYMPCQTHGYWSPLLSLVGYRTLHFQYNDSNSGLGIITEGGSSVTFARRSQLISFGHALCSELTYVCCSGSCTSTRSSYIRQEVDLGHSPRMRFHQVGHRIIRFTCRLHITSKIFPEQSVEEFHKSVRSHVLSELDGLDKTAVLKVKALLKAGEAAQNDPDATNLRESYAQAERLSTSVPQERFGKLARKEIRHKL